MPVYWLIQAQDALQNSLGEANRQAGAYEAKLAELSQRIARTFPQAEAILVIDCLSGYAVSAEKRALRAEAIHDGISHARIVKMAAPDKLAQELHGWEDCARPANDRGRVFMRLTAGSRSPNGELETLIYEDAQQALRATPLTTLEQAVRDCCRWGTPSAGSLAGILDQLFAELAAHLYARAAAAPLAGEVRQRLQETLEKGLPHWKQYGTLFEQCRRVAMIALPADRTEFFDAVEYLPRLFASDKHLPEVLRGPAHGDLNGRNVLVGIVQDEARFPALFDYEAMSRDNLPGWDFVKLETELKVRTLQEVFAGDEAAFLDAVCRFEQQLAEATEDGNNQTVWLLPPAPQTAEERLSFLLLSLRRQAKRCLETLQGRSRSWLHEYYFLLALYGVYAGRFETYRRRDALAAFVCAGCAAARFAWAKSSAANETQQNQHRARKALADNDPRVRPERAALSHHGALAFGREWTRSRRRPFVEAAIAILTELRKEYEYKVEIGQELALALMELSTLNGEETFADQALELLLQLDRQFPMASRETLCRWGRWWKDRGDQLFGHAAEGEAEMSRRAYETALWYYQRAYDLDKNYYPGINAATLSLLIGRKAEADRLARTILADLKDGRDHRPDELAWIWATLGEAYLILEQAASATEYYRRAVLHPDCQPHQAASMHAQVKRILRVQPCRGFDGEALFPS